MLHRAAGRVGAGSAFAEAIEMPLIGDLTFRLHLWSERGGIERLLAETCNPSIGYAALYAAAKEHPNRNLTLSRRGQVIYRWDGGN